MLLHLELRKAIARHLLQDDALSALMNGPIRAKLGNTIPPNVTWGGKRTISQSPFIVYDSCYFESSDISVTLECGVEVVL